MKSKIDNTSFLLAETPRNLSFFAYQLIYESNQNGMYIKSINFLHKGKILKKVYLKPIVLCNSETNYELLIRKILFYDDDQPIQKSKNDHKSKTKPDNHARFQAANNLFSNLGI